MSDKDDIKYIEGRIGQILSKTHFMSVEGGKPTTERNWFGVVTDAWKGYFIGWLDNPNGSGRHITYAIFEGDFYLAKETGKPKRRPIEFFKSGRNQ